MIKKAFLAMLVGLSVIWSLGFQYDLSAQDKPLRIYGSEGPYAPMKECAEMFFRLRGVKTEVITGPGSDWIARAKEDADVIYEETEYRLSQFILRHP